MTSRRPYLTQADIIVIQSLTHDSGSEHRLHRNLELPDRIPGVEGNEKESQALKIAENHQKTVARLQALNDPTNKSFEPTILTGWDVIDIPEILTRKVIEPYNAWASTIVRRPTDVVFLTHILLYLSTSVPSAFVLFRRFTWIHGIFHWLLHAWYCGSFTLMLHNHIHNRGVLAKGYAWFDESWPYVLEPLMGHTWDSYYYHHVKHHHVENNGPGDLSSTIRYQRDDIFDFLCYVGRFLALVWIELPIYFVQRGKWLLAIKTLLSELASYMVICVAAKYNAHATLFALILPLLQMRIGMMVGNWGQHALVDEIEPDSDFRSSITLIDVAVSTSPYIARNFKWVQADGKASPTDTASMTDTILPTTLILVATGVTTLWPLPDPGCNTEKVELWFFKTLIIS